MHTYGTNTFIFFQPTVYLSSQYQSLGINYRIFCHVIPPSPIAQYSYYQEVLHHNVVCPLLKPVVVLRPPAVQTVAHQTQHICLGLRK